MPWTTTFPILLWAVIILPLTILLFRKKPADKLTTIILLLDFTLVNLLSALILNWSIVNYWLRLLTVILPGLLIIQTILQNRLYASPFLPPKTLPRHLLLGGGLALLAGAVFLNYRALQSLQHEEEGNALGLFPVRNGLYVIVNGGNSLAGFGMNNHLNALFAPESEQDPRFTYGLDIMRLGIRGNIRQGGNFTRTFQEYVGYNDMVYSPCIGQVVYVEDGHREVEVSEQGAPLGNQVVIQCAVYYFTLGNLRNGSIDVEVGEQVDLNRFIGQIGNSGTPSIPHLHVHVTKDGWQPGEGEPVPLVFPRSNRSDRFFVRNDLTISNKD